MALYFIACSNFLCNFARTWERTQCSLKAFVELNHNSMQWRWTLTPLPWQWLVRWLPPPPRNIKCDWGKSISFEDVAYEWADTLFSELNYDFVHIVEGTHSNGTLVSNKLDLSDTWGRVPWSWLKTSDFYSNELHVRKMRGDVWEKFYLQTLEDDRQLNPGQSSTLRGHIVSFLFTLFCTYWLVWSENMLKMET
jgi:hypothetical protein